MRAPPAPRRVRHATTRATEVDVAAVGVRVPLARSRVEAVARAVLAAERARGAHLSITFVDDRAIAALNWKHLRHRGATDVISFALAGGPAASRSGDIYISPDAARRNARAYRCGVREEIARLVVHGTLHVVGWDHPEGSERVASPMWRRQERLVARVIGARAAGTAA